MNKIKDEKAPDVIIYNEGEPPIMEKWEQEMKDKEGFAKTRGKEDEDFRISYLKEKIEGIDVTIKCLGQEMNHHLEERQRHATRVNHILEIIDGLQMSLNRWVEQVTEYE